MALQRLEMTPIFISNMPSNVTWIWHHQRQHAIFFVLLFYVLLPLVLGPYDCCPQNFFFNHFKCSKQKKMHSL